MQRLYARPASAVRERRASTRTPQRLEQRAHTQHAHGNRVLYSTGNLGHVGRPVQAHRLQDPLCLTTSSRGDARHQAHLKPRPQQATHRQTLCASSPTEFSTCFPPATHPVRPACCIVASPPHQHAHEKCVPPYLGERNAWRHPLASSSSACTRAFRPRPNKTSSAWCPVVRGVKSAPRRSDMAAAAAAGVIMQWAASARRNARRQGVHCTPVP